MFKGQGLGRIRQVHCAQDKCRATNWMLGKTRKEVALFVIALDLFGIEPFGTTAANLSVIR